MIWIIHNSKTGYSKRISEEICTTLAAKGLEAKVGSIKEIEFFVQEI